MQSQNEIRLKHTEDDGNIFFLEFHWKFKSLCNHISNSVFSAVDYDLLLIILYTKTCDFNENFIVALRISSKTILCMLNSWITMDFAISFIRLHPFFRKKYTQSPEIFVKNWLREQCMQFWWYEYQIIKQLDHRTAWCRQLEINKRQPNWGIILD